MYGGARSAQERPAHHGALRLEGQLQQRGADDRLRRTAGALWQTHPERLRGPHAATLLSERCAAAFASYTSNDCTCRVVIHDPFYSMRYS